MSLFSFDTEEGRRRRELLEYRHNPKDFRSLWNSGQVDFLEVVQEGNMAGNYYRYYWLYHGVYHQTVVMVNDASAADTPFRRLQAAKIASEIYTHAPDVVFRAERVTEYIYHFQRVRKEGQ